MAEAYPSTYRVLLTGSMTAGEAVREIGTGVIQAFVTKPWSKEDIYRVLERARAGDNL